MKIANLGFDRLYNGPTPSRLDFALELYHGHHEQLLAGEKLTGQLTLLKKLASALQDHMRRMNLGPLCARCATGAGGGCCSLYMAGETDALQLLMNLLAGVPVAMVRDDGRECCYLGESGCIFLFKPIFCLNYNCSHIAVAASPGEMRELERLTGQMLTAQYQTEKLLQALLEPIFSVDKN